MFGNNSCIWIILLIILFTSCGGCGCGSADGCGCGSASNNGCGCGCN